MPDSFTVIRQLLDRIEDSKSATVIKDFHVDIPEQKHKEASDVIDILGESYIGPKVVEGVSLLSDSLKELYLNNTWRPTLCVIGQTGLPPHSTGGNVLRDSTTVRITLRIPPTLDGNYASEKLTEILLKNPPFNSKISLDHRNPGSGWAANEFSDRLKKSLLESSNFYWNKSPQTVGEGGSIPFINSLSKKFPQSDFLVIGVLGPGSNAHAANETLNIPYCKRLTSTLVHAIYDLFN